jgi:hypothetical protein
MSKCRLANSAKKRTIAFQSFQNHVRLVSDIMNREPFARFRRYADQSFSFTQGDETLL